MQQTNLNYSGEGKVQTELSKLLTPPEDRNPSLSNRPPRDPNQAYGAISLSLCALFLAVGIGLLVSSDLLSGAVSAGIGFLLLPLSVHLLWPSPARRLRFQEARRRFQEENQEISTSVEEENGKRRALWQSSYYCGRDHVVFRGPLYTSADAFSESLQGDLGAWLSGVPAGHVNRA